jgi:hypothetical protein
MFMHFVKQNHKKQTPQGVPHRGTPWGFTREFAFFKGFTGDFAGKSRLGERRSSNIFISKEKTSRSFRYFRKQKSENREELILSFEIN